MIERNDILAVDAALTLAFGRYSPSWKPGDPLTKLVAQVIHQRTTPAHVDRALGNLWAVCRDWGAVATLDHDTLVDLLRPAGLAEQKAARVQAILGQIFRETGEYSLAFLSDMDNRTATRYLRTLPGVGDLTAALVLMFALGRPGVMPMEDSVHRVARRLGWGAPGASARAVQRAIEEAAPEEQMMDLHVNLWRLGHSHCGPGMPDCPECPVSDLCRSALLQPRLQ